MVKMQSLFMCDAQACKLRLSLCF